MNQGLLLERTKALALRVIRVYQSLPSNGLGRVLGHQLLRSGTSVGANYRAACRARSPADMIAKLKIVEEEADEASYWIELLVEGGIVPQKKLLPLLKETSEITAMIVASIRTLRSRHRQQQRKLAHVSRS